jgi:predicted ribosome quality control (RQC) complex YloA/Tae2 family protein
MTSSGQPHEALNWLLGARLQRIDSPKPDLFALTFFSQGLRQTLLISLVPPLGVGIATDRPRGNAATPFVTKLRTKLENSRVVRVMVFRSEAPDRAHALEFVLARGEEQLRLLADFHPQHPNLVLLASNRTIVFSLHEGAVKAQLLQRSAPYAVAHRGRGIAFPDEAAALERIGQSLASEATHGLQESLRRELLSSLRARAKRVDRRVQAIRGDLERAGKAPLLRREAETLLCHLAEVPRGASLITLNELATDEALHITLDPAKSALDNANARFERAKKLDRGLVIAAERLREAESEYEELARQIAHVEAANEDALRELVPTRSGAASAPRTGAAARAHGRQEHKAYRIFETPSGRVLVGKGAIDNDTLTLTVARPHDHWLHARAVHGAHVVVPLARGHNIAPELLLDAAHLAAHFSDARGEPRVEVQHTERRYVRKGKKSAPGAVQLEREKVLLLRIEADRIARLLKAERV